MAETVAVSQDDYEPVAVVCISCDRPGTVIIERGSHIARNGWKCGRCVYRHEKVEQEIAENAIAEQEEMESAG